MAHKTNKNNNNQSNNSGVVFGINNVGNELPKSADDKLAVILDYLYTLQQRAIAEMNLYNNPLNEAILAAATNNGDLQRVVQRLGVINEISDVIRVISGNVNGCFVVEQ